VTRITREQVRAHRLDGSWRRLERIALDIMADVRLHAGAGFAPVLGGGTRLMLALDHRISHDLDLFIRDPQWLGWISPRLNDRVEAMVSAYEEAADFLKLNFPEGELDFIVRGSLLGLPHEASEHTPLPLEPLAEVLAKKLFYRAGLLTPRDVFDWWALETLRPGLVPEQAMGQLLDSRYHALSNLLAILPQSSAARRVWDGILAPDKPDLADTARWARDTLERYHRAARHG